MKKGQIRDLNHLYWEVRESVDAFLPLNWKKECIHRMKGMTKEDLIQEIILSLLEKDNREDSPFVLAECTKSYVRVRAFQYLVDVYRSGANTGTRLDAEEDVDMEELGYTDNEFDTFIDVLAADEAIQKLPEPLKEVLMYVGMGYSNQEIMEILTETSPLNYTHPRSITNLVWRARKELRRLMGDDEG